MKSLGPDNRTSARAVRALAGAGSEISIHALMSTVTPVRPLAGAGIEIYWSITHKHK